MIVFYGRSGLITRKFSDIRMPIADSFLSKESWVDETDGSKDGLNTLQALLKEHSANEKIMELNI